MATKKDMEEVNMEEGEGGGSAPVEKALDPVDETNKSSGAVWSKPWFWVAVVMLVVGLTFGLGFGLSDDDDKNVSQANLSTPGDGNNNPDDANEDLNEDLDIDTDPTDDPTNDPNNDPTIEVASSLPSRSSLLQGFTLPMISKETIAETYTSCTDLKKDLVKAARYVADNTINCTVEWYFNENWSYGGCGGGGFMPFFPTFGLDDAMLESTMDAGEKSPVSGGNGDNIQTSEDSFGTNNQIEGVDEADLMKSSRDQAFAVYGREIVTYDIAANAVTNRTTLPKSEASGEDMCVNGGDVRGMLLVDGRLVVFSQDYTYYCPPPPPPKEEPEEGEPKEEPEEGEPKDEVVMVDSSVSSLMVDSSFPGDPGRIGPIVQDSAVTNVYIYDTSNMALISSSKLSGNYISARSINNDAYLVTSAHVNIYDLTKHFDPYNEDIYGSDFDEETYRATAVIEAVKQAEAFAERLVEELDCTSMQPIALLQNSVDALSFSGVMDSLVSVHAFAITPPEDTLTVQSEAVNTRTMMLPSSGWNVFASGKFLALAGEGYRVTTVEEDPEDDATTTTVTQETYLIVFELDGPTTSDVFVGTVPGYALNQFSMDHFTDTSSGGASKEYFRIATCERQRWGWGIAGNWDAMEKGLCEVNILEIADDMPIVGTVPDLGKEGERIYSVRFQGERGFVVTFRETDPFYTLDLSNATNPTMVGELFIEGFSSYLHPIGDDYILGVGQEVKEGRRAGLKISLFDVSTFSAPEEVIKFVEDGGSSSSAEYDHRAFRYLPESGILIIPMTIYGDSESGNGLDGFSLYSIDVESPLITDYMSVQHGSGNFFGFGCWSSSGWLNERSIVVGGRLHTFKSHTIVASDLSDRTLVNELNLDENLSKEDCASNYFGSRGF